MKHIRNDEKGSLLLAVVRAVTPVKGNKKCGACAPQKYYAIEIYLTFAVKDI